MCQEGQRSRSEKKRKHWEWSWFWAKNISSLWIFAWFATCCYCWCLVWLKNHQPRITSSRDGKENGLDRQTPSRRNLKSPSKTNARQPPQQAHHAAVVGRWCRWTRWQPHRPASSLDGPVIDLFFFVLQDGALYCTAAACVWMFRCLWWWVNCW